MQLFHILFFLSFSREIITIPSKLDLTIKTFFSLNFSWLQFVQTIKLRRMQITVSLYFFFMT